MLDHRLGVVSKAGRLEGSINDIMDPKNLEMNSFNYRQRKANREMRLMRLSITITEAIFTSEYLKDEIVG